MSSLRGRWTSSHQIMEDMKKHASYWSCVLGMSLLMACTPALNWREVRFDAGDVLALMPCKPDTATREIRLQAGTSAAAATLQLQGCEAADLQFTFGQITLPPGVLPETALNGWVQASLAPLAASDKDWQLRPWALPGALSAPSARVVNVKTAAHWAQLGWFVRGERLYQVGVYAAVKNKSFDDTADVYFSGIKLQ